MHTPEPPTRPSISQKMTLIQSPFDLKIPSFIHPHNKNIINIHNHKSPPAAISQLLFKENKESIAWAWGNW